LGFIFILCKFAECQSSNHVLLGEDTHHNLH
jgi:hypothetical protein